MNFTNLTDNDLLSSLKTLMGGERQILARMLAYLAEVDQRRLHLKAACSSLFDFCRRRLGLSEGEAFRRITAARLIQRFPRILGWIERGLIHLSALVLLRDHLTDENHEELVGAAAGKSKREVQELLATRFPKPDVPATLRRLPTTATPPARVGSATVDPTPPTGVEGTRTPAPMPKPRLEPLSKARYKLQLTASAVLRDKLERARELMRHRNPNGDLAVVLERAIDLLIADLEKDRIGKAARPQKTKRAAKPEHVTRAVRREVFARDGEQCSFMSAAGARCPSRTFLELDHIHPRALGGSGEADNIRVYCRSHNQLRAEQVFGREHVRRKIRLRQRKSTNETQESAAATRKKKAESAKREAPRSYETASSSPMNMGFREGEVVERSTWS